MKVLSLALSLFLVLACSDSGVFAPPTAFAAENSALTGTIFFQIDAASCKYSGARATTFMIQNTDVGTESLAPGQTSTGYAANGWVTVQARIAGFTSTFYTTPTTLWSLRYSVRPPDGGSVTQVITC